jgi:hypothetical protein
MINQFLDPGFFDKEKDQNKRECIIREVEKELFFKITIKAPERELNILTDIYSQICL